MSYQPLPASSPPPSPVVRTLSLEPLQPVSSNISPSRVKVDLSKLEEGFSRWISKVKAGGRHSRRQQRQSKRDDKRDQELYESVFGKGGVTPNLQPMVTDDGLTSEEDFQMLVASVRLAIQQGVHPKLIAKGSSGSYFALNEEGNIVGVFKPKDEEPYGRLNPKWTKWLHRNAFWWIGWGRACLIPNLSYVSEAAASHLDRRMGLGIVPRTEVVSLSSPAFFYDWVDRTAFAQRKRPLPDKVGSFQVFMSGYRDATEWLRNHPWPGLTTDDEPRRARHYRRCLRACALVCGRAGADEWGDEDEEEELQRSGEQATERPGKPFRWTRELQQDFWEELQKLICLDYLMHNTDRGLDNFMIKLAPGSTTPVPSTIISSEPSLVPGPSMDNGLKRTSLLGGEDPNRPSRIKIAAIDNSLSFPHHHPKGWRSYPYGWLFLPVSLIGQPFGHAIRDHLIPLLSSPAWWDQTVRELRQLFELDPDFSELMWDRQLAVLKGQGYNLLESLRHADEGPLELCRRDRLEVLTESVSVPDDSQTTDTIATLLGSKATPASPPLPITSPSSPTSQWTTFRPNFRRSKSISGGSAFSNPPSSSSFSSATQAQQPTFRPVSFAGRLRNQNTWKGFSAASGVELLSALEQVDSAERRLLAVARAGPKGRRKKTVAARGIALAEEDEEREEEADQFLGNLRGAFSDGEEEPGLASSVSRGRFQLGSGRRGGGGAPRSSSSRIQHRRHASSGESSSVLNGIAESEDETADVEGHGEEDEDEGEELTRSTWSLGGVGGGRGHHHGRWGSTAPIQPEGVADAEEEDEEGLRTVDHENDLESGAMRTVKVERLKLVTERAWLNW